MKSKYGIVAGLTALFVLFISICQPAFSQAAGEKFGKNRIQYKDFDWRFYYTENFDIYFYDGGEQLARSAAEFLEEEFEKITDLLGYAPYFKTKIFLYNSISDLHQSNVGMKGKKYSEGGQTDFVKTQVEIAFPGTAEDFKDELIYKISKMLVYDMMYGGSFTDMLQNTYLLNLPEWFMEGASLYLARGWDVKMDDYMRDLMRQKRVKNLNKYTGDEARMIGQSIWNYIAEKYGKSNISNVLNLTRITRNQERSLSNTLGISFRQFLVEWTAFYSSMSAKISGSYQFPSDEERLTKNRKDIIYPDIAINPDGTRLAYSVVNSGRFKVYVSDLSRNKSKHVISGGHKIIEQDVDESHPVLSWQDNNNLGIIAPRNGKSHLWLFNVVSRRITKKELGRLNNVRSFDIDQGGSLAVVSADIDGKNDLYLISLRRNSIKRITNDLFDDVYPRFVPNTAGIVFSSNRTTDTLLIKENTGLNAMNQSFNLFVYSIDTTKGVLSRLTNTLGNNIKPIPANETEIYYLSDQKGIYNVYKLNLSNNIYNQVSSYALSVKDFDIDLGKSKISFVSFADEKEQIYVVDGYNFDNNIFTPATSRQDIGNARMAAQRLLQRKSLQKPAEEGGEKTEAIVEVPVLKPKTEIERLLDESDSLINTDNYTFSEEVLEEAKPRESFLEAFRKTHQEPSIGGPSDYETRFSADNVATTFIIDPLIGFGIQLKTQLTDLLEDHNFYGGVTVTSDFSSGRLFAEYQYLKKRIDYGFRYDRNVIKASNSDVNQKYTLNKFTFSSNFPFSVSSRFSLSPFFATTSYYDLSYSIVFPNPPSQQKPSKEMTHYGGFEASYVFDNTIATGLNAYEGLKAKLSFIHYESLKSSASSFSNIKLDIRNHQKIYRELVFATRFFYGRFLGNNKQTYLLGGMDNWIFNKTDNTSNGERNPLQLQELVNNSNILFLEYITSLRGFNYNAFNGSNVMLFNAELRLPLLRVLYKGPIASNFFRNLQFIGFYDIGSAWTGNSPFATENNINTETINTIPFEIKLKNFRNPWLSSYGFGARTVILGYYVKFDVAYPIEDYVVQKPRFHISLGYDF